jgi:hypothetical protein
LKREKKIDGPAKQVRDNSVSSVHNRDSEGNKLQVQCSRILKKVTGEKVIQTGQLGKCKHSPRGPPVYTCFPPFLFETCLLPLGVTAGLPKNWVYASPLQFIAMVSR